MKLFSTSCTAYVLPKTTQSRAAQRALAGARASQTSASEPAPYIPSLGRTLAFDLLTLPGRSLLGCAPSLLVDPIARGSVPRTAGLLHLVRSGLHVATSLIAGIALVSGALLGAIVGRVVSMASEDKGRQAAMLAIYLSVRIGTFPTLALLRGVNAVLAGHTALIARAAASL